MEDEKKSQSEHEERKLKRRLQRYGLSKDEFDDLLARSMNQCEICRKPPKNRPLAIDHEHVRGWAKMPPNERRMYVRGLLCWKCNTGLKKWNDDAWRMEQAAWYINRYNGTQGITLH